MGFFQRIKNFFKKLVPDIRDVLIFSGLFSLGVGLWWFKPWVSLTVIGLILIIFGILGSLRKGE